MGYINKINYTDEIGCVNYKINKVKVRVLIILVGNKGKWPLFRAS